MYDSKISAALALSVLSTPSFSTPPQNPRAPAPFEISTSARSSVRAMNSLLSAAPTLAPMGTYVGELQELWQFPSDHLPVGINYRGIDIASWNVLSSEYMGWVIEKNSQGLSRSMIADTHVYIGNSKLTVRDQIVVDKILEMLSHPTHPRSLVCLQETGKPFLKELHSRLPAHIKLITHNGNSTLIDQRQFKIVSAKPVFAVFSDGPKRSFQDLTVEHLASGEKIRLVNVHLPGDPEGPGRYEFAGYLAKTTDGSLPTIAMGDMNFDELQMRDALERSSFSVPYTIHSPYCTNIDPTTHFSKAIDHFLVFDRDGSEIVHSQEEELLSGLDTITRLLSPHGQF